MGWTANTDGTGDCGTISASVAYLERREAELIERINGHVFESADDHEQTLDELNFVQCCLMAHKHQPQPDYIVERPVAETLWGPVPMSEDLWLDLGGEA